MSKKVNKMLGTEEQTMLSNIQSIIGELLAMGGEQAPTEPEEVELAEASPVETPEENSAEEKEVKMIVKALGGLLKAKSIETTPSDAATASDKTEDRIDEVQTEPTEENVQEVAKMLLAQALGLQVQKSEPAKKVDPTLQAVSQMVQVQKSQQEQFNELSLVVKNLLEGIGIVDQLKVSKDATTKATPSNEPQNKELFAMIQKALSNGNIDKEQTVNKSNGQIARDNLSKRDVLCGLLGRKI